MVQATTDLTQSVSRLPDAVIPPTNRTAIIETLSTSSTIIGNQASYLTATAQAWVPSLSLNLAVCLGNRCTLLSQQASGFSHRKIQPVLEQLAGRDALLLADCSRCESLPGGNLEARVRSNRFHLIPVQIAIAFFAAAIFAAFVSLAVGAVNWGWGVGSSICFNVRALIN